MAQWALRQDATTNRKPAAPPPGIRPAVMASAPGESSAAKAGATMIEHTTGGKMSLAELADGHKCQPSAILRLTAEHSPGGAYPANVSAYINAVFRGTIAATDHMPAGLHLYLP
jgi:hypothetical protein